MKLKVKNLKGEVFEVEVEPENSVLILIVRSSTSKIKSRKPKAWQQILSKSFSREKLSTTKTQLRKSGSRILILLSA